MQNILEDFIPLTDAAQMPGMPTLRVLTELAKQGKIPVTAIGRRKYLNVLKFRELLLAGTLKVDGAP